MNSTSLTPTSLSVPPDFGVPGLSAWLPPVRDDDADVDGPAEPPLDVELLHAAASTVRATTAVAAPMARNRKCLTTLLLLQNHRRRSSAEWDTGGACPAELTAVRTRQTLPLGWGDGCTQ